MTQATLMRVAHGFVPANDDSIEALARVKVGAIINVEYRQVRNYRFLKKFFAMLKLGFDHWEPATVEHNGMPVQKNIERFRKDCLVAAGYYEPVVALNGEVRAEADSISFANMDEAEFEKVYSAVVDVLLQRVLTTYTRDDLDRVVNNILAFT